MTVFFSIFLVVKLLPCTPCEAVVFVGLMAGMTKHMAYVLSVFNHVMHNALSIQKPDNLNYIRSSFLLLFSDRRMTSAEASVKYQVCWTPGPRMSENVPEKCKGSKWIVWGLRPRLRRQSKAPQIRHDQDLNMQFGDQLKKKNNKLQVVS